MTYSDYINAIKKYNLAHDGKNPVENNRQAYQLLKKVNPDTLTLAEQEEYSNLMNTLEDKVHST